MSIRTLMKTGVAAALRYSGADAVLRSCAGIGEPLILGYHMVVEDVRPYAGRAIPFNLISVATLERQLDWIGRRYRPVSLDELSGHVDGQQRSGKPAAAVTFDDGYVGVYEHALPLLRRKGIPAGVFVVTDSIGRPQLQLYDRLYLLLAKVLPALDHSVERLTSALAVNGLPLTGFGDRGRGPADVWTVMRGLFTTLPQPQLRNAIGALETMARIDESGLPHLRSMSWDMLSALDKAGITVGSHTRTHALLTLEEARVVREETAGSARALSERLGRPVRHFAYPDGRFNPAVVSAVEAAGYRFAYTTCRHRDPYHPQLTIPRKLLWEKSCLDRRGGFSPSLMSYQASAISGLLAPCRQNHRGQTAGGEEVPARTSWRSGWSGMPEC